MLFIILFTVQRTADTLVYYITAENK